MHISRCVFGDGLLLEIRIRCERYVYPAAGLGALSHTEHNGVLVTWVRHVHWASEHVAWNSLDIKPLDYAVDVSFNGRAASAYGHHWVKQTLAAVHWLRHKWMASTPPWVRRWVTRSDTVHVYCETVKLAVYCRNFVCLKPGHFKGKLSTAQSGEWDTKASGPGGRYTCKRSGGKVPQRLKHFRACV